MSHGPLLGKIVLFAVPLMLSGILQLLFNTADIVVVGRFAGNTALAAVGSTTSLINLVINLLIGLSIGASVSVAQFFGARKFEDASEAVHTAISISLIGGVILGVFGIVTAERLLMLMGSPYDVRPQAALYLRIYFAGLPALMLYNFGSSILRAVGDTKRPLYFLTIAGILNVGFNLLFVIKFKMGVAGVAIATVISEIVSAALITLSLIRTTGCCKLELKRLTIKKDKLAAIVKVGLPAGVQSTLFSISNVLIQSTINSFGSIAMAGNAAAGNLEGFVYTAMNSVSQAALSFTGQNIGAGKYERVGPVVRICCALTTAAGLVLGVTAYLLGDRLVSLYSIDPAVIACGTERLLYICAPYFLCGIMDVFAWSMRGMGRSTLPMAVSLFGICGLRVLWLYTFFANSPKLTTLYISYPISWVVTGCLHMVCYFILKRRLNIKAVDNGGLKSAL